VGHLLDIPGHRPTTGSTIRRTIYDGMWVIAGATAQVLLRPVSGNGDTSQSLTDLSFISSELWI
jgi:hypothetical protein